jgi:hypothetical protein
MKGERRVDEGWRNKGGKEGWRIFEKKGKKREARGESYASIELAEKWSFGKYRGKDDEHSWTLVALS